MMDDKDRINKFPEDAAEVAALVQRADSEIAVKLLQVWGSKQRDIGAIHALTMFKATLGTEA